MKKLAVALIVLFSTSAAFAAEGPLLIRLRGVYVDTADKSDAILALDVPSNSISVSKKLIPEVDISYFFTPNISAELILTYPQKHDVKVSGVGKIGTVTELPPCLTIQSHFLPDAMVDPYIGVGANLTLVTGQSLSVPLATALPLEVSKSSMGVVAQAGVDVKVMEHLVINADIKWVQMGFDVKTKADGAKVSHVDVNPWLFGVGVGYRL